MDILRHITLAPINTSKRQFIFSNISDQALKIAQKQKTETVLIDLLSSLLVEVSKFINVWADFFTFKI